MKRLRGLLVLGLALLLGLAAAKAVFVYLSSKPKTESKPEIVAKPAPPPKAVNLTENIPVGMRAVSIKVDEVTGVSRKVIKGDWVDVLATTPLPGSPHTSVARLVLDRVQVFDVTLEADTKGQSKQKGEKDWTVTLLVTPDQGATLLAAASQAKISLLARQANDARPHNFRDIAFAHQEGTAFLLKPDGDATDWIHPGMRAVTLKVRDTDGICANLRRGDRVDVLLTCPFSRFASGGNVAAGAQGTVTDYEMVTRTLLQDVEVLVSEKGLEPNTEDNEPVRLVTLQMTPHDAEKVTCALDATSKDIIRLVSRNKRDRRLVCSPGQELSSLLMRKKEYNRIDVYKGTRAHVKPFFKEYE
ncbi:Flp pilus assembly protein CpaB [Desulfobacca acetoxidans]|uniref:Flp pilus assembly protein RcpC/CpaB domain-containing protein n=1 Tax=Desulfobacca acetoxidans (strain ATCC 700848 / DSM 11109 / ASRB2) TaxID=880072 RepID=F2NFB3_DESAR|nr:Flp pilus assembly protein CpaB [Desulfobacca acetoxidans]AEB08668.1 hypothetical protein Desac_0789 [Desulfobacca acetoxidans DSM 11109]